MSSQVRPSFFCSRPNGSLTPLIAIDDLPSGVSVRGISRTLTAGETQGMISCGTAEPRSEPWTLEGAAPAGKDAITNEDTAELQAVLLKIMADDNVPTHLRMAINGLLYRHGASFPIAAPVTVAVTGRQSAPPVYYGNTRGKQTYHPKKEFCSYWIRHGECDYSQQGCMFKHEMPTDIAMLEKLGLRDIPRWYREKFNVPSLLQASYGNHHRGQQQQAAVDQPAQKAIQHHLAANNASTAGSSVHATGITNAANNASTAGPSGQAHGNGNVAHHAGNNNAANNTGNKNNNGNGNQGRGGRYKSPHGVGFGASKGRGNSNWGKNAQRNGVTPPPANINIAKDTRGDDTPTTASPQTSSGSAFSLSSGTQIDLLAMPMVNPMTNVNLSGHILDKDVMARKNSLAARLRRLTTEDSHASTIPEEEEPEQAFYRTKTRRVFNFGGDGKLVAKARAQAQAQGIAAFDPFASLTKDETPGKTTTAALTPMIRELVATSQPIDPNEPLINWGAIGEPVQHPAPTAHATYAMALIKGQSKNGFNGKFAYPYMGQH